MRVSRPERNAWRCISRWSPGTRKAGRGTHASMASELSSYIDNELKKMEEQPENQRLLSALRVKVGTRDPAVARLPFTPPSGAGPLAGGINST